MAAERISNLFTRYMEGSATEAERFELSAMTLMAENIPLIKSLEQEYWEKMKESEGGLTGEEIEKLMRKIEMPKPAIVKSIFWRRIAIAASIILTLGAGSYFIFFNKGKQSEIVKTTLPNDIIAPTATKAIITLANGQIVLLDSLHSGTLAIQGNVNVLKTADGQIVYNGSATTIEYNSLFNPRGSKVQPLTLSDGTKVWLNSESSIRFPTAFTGNERNVEITGEAYFEVAHEVARPFIVKDVNRGTAIQVLGTHFNVDTYSDEPAMKVTLLEGSVKVVKGTTINILKPGQQAQVGATVKIISTVDIDEVMAWKNGRFQFNKASLQEVMRQLARWYDVEIVYEGKIAPQQFGGKMQRDLKLSEVLDGLAKSQVHFRIEGKKVVVMP